MTRARPARASGALARLVAVLLVVIAVPARAQRTRPWDPPDLLIIVDPTAVNGHDGRGLALAHAIAAACDRFTVDVARSTTFEEVLELSIRSIRGPVTPGYTRRVPSDRADEAFWADGGPAHNLLRVPERHEGGLQGALIQLNTHPDFAATTLVIFAPGREHAAAVENLRGRYHRAEIDPSGAGDADTVCRLLGPDCVPVRSDSGIPLLPDFGTVPYERAIVFLPAGADTEVGHPVRHRAVNARAVLPADAEALARARVAGPVQVARFRLSACGAVSIPSEPTLSLDFVTRHDRVTGVRPRVHVDWSGEHWVDPVPLHVLIDGREPRLSAAGTDLAWPAGGPAVRTLTFTFPGVEGMAPRTRRVFDFGTIESGESRCLPRGHDGYAARHLGPLAITRESGLLCVQAPWNALRASAAGPIDSRDYVVATVAGIDVLLLLAAHLVWLAIAAALLGAIARNARSSPPTHVAERVGPRAKGFREATASRWEVTPIEDARAGLERRGLELISGHDQLLFQQTPARWSAPYWPSSDSVIAWRGVVQTGTVIALDEDDALLFCDEKLAAAIAGGAEPPVPDATMIDLLSRGAPRAALPGPPRPSLAWAVAAVWLAPMLVTYALPELSEAFWSTSSGLTAAALAHIATLAAAALWLRHASRSR